MSRWAALGKSAKQALLWSPVVLVVNDNFAGFCKISGRSMQPTFNPGDGSVRDLVLVNKLCARLCSYQRGDVIVLRSPRRPKERLVKRLIGIEGDWLLAADHPDIIKVPKGHCWVEGDSAGGSLDSATELGPLPLALVEGCVLAVCWPRLERVPNRLPPGKLLMRSSGDDVRVIT